MANPSIHLNQLIGQLKELPYFVGNSAELGGYIGRFEYLLYTTQVVRQIHIIYGAVERAIADAAKAVILEEKTMNWTCPDFAHQSI